MILLVGRWDNFYTPLANNNGVKEKIRCAHTGNLCSATAIKLIMPLGLAVSLGPVNAASGSDVGPCA